LNLHIAALARQKQFLLPQLPIIGFYGLTLFLTAMAAWHG